MTNEQELKSLFRHDGYYLVVVQPDGKVSVDGSHSTPHGVTKAKKLYESISVIRPTEGSTFHMVRVLPVPDRPAKVNRKAIDTLNEMARQ